MAHRLATVTIVLLLGPSFSSVDFHWPARGADGEALYAQLKDDLNKYGKCWQDAVDKLESTCGGLTEEKQHRLALDFTNCFLEKMRSDAYICLGTESLEECSDFKRLAKGPHIGTYTSFFTHTQVICSFLQSQKWQTNTVELINTLSLSSEELSNRLSSLNKVVQDTRDDHSHLQELTQASIDANKDLAVRLTSQGSSLGRMLDQIHYVNNVIAGHASSLYSFLYFLGGIMASLLLTCVQQTRPIRPLLLILFTINLLLELAILQHAIEFAGIGHEYFKDDNPISFRLSICRRFFCCVSLVVYIYKALTFRTPEDICQDILLNVSKDVSKLDERLNRIELALSATVARFRKSIFDQVDYRTNHTEGYRNHRRTRDSYRPTPDREATPLRSTDIRCESRLTSEVHLTPVRDNAIESTPLGPPPGDHTTPLRTSEVRDTSFSEGNVAALSRGSERRSRQKAVSPKIEKTSESNTETRVRPRRSQRSRVRSLKS